MRNVGVDPTKANGVSIQEEQKLKSLDQRKFKHMIINTNAVTVQVKKSKQQSIDQFFDS